MPRRSLLVLVSIFTLAVALQSSAVAAPVITDIGATTSAWFAHHVPDLGTCQAPGENPCYATSYDPSKTLPEASICHGDRYCSVAFYSGYVIQYTMEFADGVKVKAAEQQALGQVPGGKILWYWRAKSADCAEVGVTSAVLTKAGTPSGGGGVLVGLFWGLGPYLEAATFSLAARRPFIEPYCGGGLQ